ncbi:hypothetical protein VNO77_05549 [Canavalia gladiata]|uniref:Uncharacterized protein n=1 Tax=Canavalia gladiata TaxID=3824 RepID=A0AAN9MZB2_CANGL
MSNSKEIYIPPSYFLISVIYAHIRKCLLDWFCKFRFFRVVLADVHINFLYVDLLDLSDELNCPGDIADWGKKERSRINSQFGQANALNWGFLDTYEVLYYFI